jgi:ABC-type transport system substrate-binding protein
MEEPRPGSAEFFASSDLFGAVAREVVEFYGEQIDAHPVGTGPFKLKSWRRSSEIVLERNPTYRERFYEAEPAANDKEGQAILARFEGQAAADDRRGARRDHRAEPADVAVLPQCRSRCAGHQCRRVPPDFLALAMPGGKIAPYLAKRGIQGVRNLNPDSGLAYFNMEDPVVGGYTPEKIALRRAIALAYDADVEIKQIRRGGIRAQSPWCHTPGLRPAVQERDGRLRPGTRARLARSVRLCRSRQRRLARPARWQAVDDRDGEPAR